MSGSSQILPSATHFGGGELPLEGEVAYVRLTFMFVVSLNTLLVAILNDTRLRCWFLQGKGTKLGDIPNGA